MKGKKRKGTLYLALPLLGQPRKSKSRKSWLVATSSGPKRTSAKFDGNPVYAIVNAIVYPDAATDARWTKTFAKVRRLSGKRNRTKRMKRQPSAVNPG